MGTIEDIGKRAWETSEAKKSMDSGSAPCFYRASHKIPSAGNFTDHLRALLYALQMSRRLWLP